jgi:hypothetical protein
MGIPTGSTEGSTHHQFPFRGAATSRGSVSDPGVAFLGVYRRQIAEDEMEAHKGG